MASPSTHSPLQPGSPNPQANPFRPHAYRAATLSTSTYPYKTRAASQPAAAERLPVPTAGSSPSSGRGSPGIVAASAFGVIGGSRTPVTGRFGSALASGTGTQTRANSFSAGDREVRDPRNWSLARTLSSHVEHAEEHHSRSQSGSPFPTFSPNSSLSGSPADLHHETLPHASSPPRAGANASRSRSQSLATGARPIQERGFMMPMSTLENTGAFPRLEGGWATSPRDPSNMSPFTRGLPHLSNNLSKGGEYAQPVAENNRFRLPHDTFANPRNAWGSSAPEKQSPSTLSSSVARALGGFNPPVHSVVGGFGENHHSHNGNKSGSSSRRHSVSVVSGPGGRRENPFGEGQGMSMMSPPGPGRGLGPLGFTDEELLPKKLENALSLEIDESRRRGVEIEVGGDRGRENNHPGGHASSLPRFDPEQRGIPFPRTRGNTMNEGGMGNFGSSPVRGRSEQVQIDGERDPSGESKDGSHKSRFSFENPMASPGNGRTNGAHPALASPSAGGRMRDNSAGPIGGFPRGPGPIGAPPMFDPRVPMSLPPYLHQQQQQTMYAARHGGFPAGSMGPPSPNAMFRPHQGYNAYYGAPNRPPMPGPTYSNPGGPNYGPPPIGQANYGQERPYQPNFPTPGSPQPTSPGASFSSLSLSDLGKGLPLTSLPPTTPLYIVAFKASRRDVFYCPDPTLLISNGDRVIVEADRGSDLGTVIYDQLTPIEVREWQERQATAALLSGASQHQPPGMIQVQQRPAAKLQPRIAMGGGGEFAGMDLSGLLAGVGPSGQPEMGGTTQRGPLAKEVMPKRIFAKSSQGPEEQARMLEKLKDEYEALMICREKVMMRNLPMQVVDAEYQWDRRKLTFYFKADKRVDFRDLTKENFRIFKSRIWMSMVPKDDPRM